MRHRSAGAIALIVGVIIVTGLVTSASSGAATAPNRTTKADALRIVSDYLRLRADAALENGNAEALSKLLPTKQGIVERYYAQGFRMFHENMGDYPVANEIDIQDATVQLKGERAVVIVTVRTMTSFSPKSQRSCDEGVVATHTINLDLSADGTYTIVSDVYPPEGTTAYLTAAGAPSSMIDAARAKEEAEMRAAAAAQAKALSVPPDRSTASTDDNVDEVATPNYVDVFPYDRSAVVAYAKEWWNKRNDYYNNYGSNDCANFVSQCTSAGGMGMFGAASDPETHKWFFRHASMTDTMSWRYCPTQVDAWRWEQPNRSPARRVVTLSSSKPSGYTKGDVAWKINSGSETHALICTGLSGSTPLFSCHSANHWNKPLSTWTGTNEFGKVANQWIVN